MPQRLDEHTKSLYDLSRKPNKPREEWLTLWEAGWADYDDANDSFILNEVGLAGGADRWDNQLKQMRRQGAGPL